MSRTAGVRAWMLGAALVAAAVVGAGRLSAAPVPRPQQIPPAQTAANDPDKTLPSMHDELQRSISRLVLPGQEKPYYIEYRLLDIDERTVVAQFGDLVSSTTTRNRFMSVDVRVGNYHVDSSNFVGEGFRGFLGGSTGTVGIDGDYDSLREDLWLATDQAYKAALDSLSRKQGVLRSLANAPTIDDFSQEPPLVQVDPRQQPDWTARNWEAEARTVSAVLRNYPELYGSRVVYRMTYATTYLMTSEGTQIRTSRSFASIEAGMGAQADDGMAVHNYVALYANKPGELPAVDAVRQQLDGAGRQLVAIRAAPASPDYDGPILFEAPAAGALLAQVLGPSLSGARPLLSTNERFDQNMQALGGRSEWSGRAGQRVLPNGVTLTDDPTAQEFQGHELIGSYGVDQEGVRAQKVAMVEDGMLHDLLMSRRPGPEFTRSNGHGRSTYLADPRPMSSNLFFSGGSGQSPADLRAAFLKACKDNGQRWCLLVREMDNPVIASSSQDELQDALFSLASGAPDGDRMPLLVYRVYVDDGHEEPVRGALLTGLNARALRTVLGIGNDSTVFTYLQSEDEEIAGTALGAFGTADNGVPSTVIAPSLLFEEVEVKGPHGEPRRMPLVPPPPLQ